MARSLASRTTLNVAGKLQSLVEGDLVHPLPPHWTQISAPGASGEVMPGGGMMVVGPRAAVPPHRSRVANFSDRAWGVLDDPYQ